VTQQQKKIDWSSLYKKEDWWALWSGLLIFFLALPVVFGVDLLGWVNLVSGNWLDPAKSVSVSTKAYGWLHPAASIILTYLFILAMFTIGAKAMGYNLKRFIVGFTFIYWVTFFCWWIGSWAYVAATPHLWPKLGIPWALSLTPEAGFLFALILGLLIGNFARGFAEKLKEAARPEWYIKTAIVLLGTLIGVMAITIDPRVLANYLFRGLCAIVEAYLIYWALVYLFARKIFKFTREWAAPLASGISVCGVSAAIATAAAIKAHPRIPIMISSLIIIFAMIELLILPWLAMWVMGDQPLVAGAWMGLAVKTDGAAAASAAMTEALILARHPEWEPYLKGWILNAGIVTKIFIDIFIGVWAFLLAVIWVTHIEKRPGEKVSKLEIWFRFPKFVLGYFATFLIAMAVGSWLVSQFQATGMTDVEAVKKAEALMSGGLARETDGFLRKFFFAMTFFSIGLVSDFRVLRQEGYGKMALVYFLALFGFIIWIGLFISWIFFHDVHWLFTKKGP
jgi:uncharacterized membrane protein YadS